MSKTRPDADVIGQEMAETVIPGREGPGGGTQTEIGGGGGSDEAGAAGVPRREPKVRQGSGAAKKVQRLGDFEIRRQLGQGGMGKVYLAHQISLDRDCALKVMSRELAARPGFVERFIREARAMAKLDHPHIVKCYAVDEQQGVHFVAMELIDGRSMQDWLDELEVLSIADALHVILICADALEHAHGLNMIHRDIKPDNILVTKHGIVKVADLGLAKAIDDDMSMTQSGTGLGTPHYMPPEQARDAKHADVRCDIYALGCTLYHFVTGKLPFAGDSIIQLIKNKEQGRFTSARRLNPQVPERLSLIIDKMMAREPRHRYASCAEVIRDLEALHLAGASLSFVDSSARPGLRTGNRLPVARLGGAPAVKQKPRTARAESARATETPKAGSEPEDMWYVKYVDIQGNITVSRMSAAQILQGLRSDRLDLRTRVSQSSQGPFLPIAQATPFEGDAKRSATRVHAHRREANLARAYAKIERQYNRQKWWRLLARFRDGTLGLVGLILWLLLVAAVIVGLGLAVMYAYQYLGHSLPLQ